jgi:GTP cyclohydrolase III
MRMRFAMALVQLKGMTTMLVVNFGKEYITVKDRHYVPITDTVTSISALITRLKAIDEKYEVKSVFLAGDSIVGSCVTEGDYVCLVAEVTALKLGIGDNYALC